MQNVGQREASTVPRAVYILLLLYANKSAPVREQLKLEKLVFLFEQQLKTKGLHIASESYNFRPYHYGPFSEDVLDDVYFLKDLGMVNVDEDEEKFQVSITEKGKEFLERMIQRNAIPKSILKEAETLKGRWNEKDTRLLLKYVYENYREYTEKSLIRELF